jgi:hypothetical protein
MGMMDMAPVPQQQAAPAPQQGMMGGNPPAAPQSQDPALSHGKFNATVEVEGKPVQVQNGVAKVDGKPYIVSDDGQLVLDSKGTLVGHIVDNKFVPADQAYLKQMQEKGYVQ